MIMCRCSGRALDFIELDGSIDTSLNVSDATVNQKCRDMDMECGQRAVGGR